jgi:hypothetical protein
VRIGNDHAVYENHSGVQFVDKLSSSALMASERTLMHRTCGPIVPGSFG